MKSKISGLLAVSLLAGSVGAQAATISSVDRATFLAAVAGGTVGGQSFDGLANGSILGAVSGVTYAASTGSPLVTSTYLTSTPPNGLGRTEVGYFLESDTATFTFDSPVTAFAIDVNTFAVGDAAYSALLDTGDIITSLYEVFSGQATGQFIGFASSSPFTSVTVRALTGFAYTLDTLAYGQASAVVDVPTVPEPASFALLALGLAGLGLSRRRGS